MAHHEHYGQRFDSDHSASTMHARPSTSSTMPSISEGEHVAESDEPPDMAHQQEQKPLFSKTACRPAPAARRESLLTKGLHTDSESQDHDDHATQASKLQQYPSRSSTCSTQSGHSAGNWTSDEALQSPSTMASTPTSPRTSVALSSRQALPPKISFQLTKPNGSTSATVTVDDSENKTGETKVEAELGRKRCISFFCKGSKPEPATAEQAKVVPEPASTETVKRPSTIRFACPSSYFPKAAESAEEHHRALRRHSPAPPTMTSSPSPSTKSQRRGHRDSDSTIKLESPRESFRNLPGLRRISTSSQPPRNEATRFHEFASSDEEVEDWLQASTCYKSRLTVEDTLKRENDIRKLTEEAEEEALADELDEADNTGDDDEIDPFSDYDLEDDGFQSDIEAGFASSDDESDDDSDYEWWAPKRSTTASPYVPPKSFRRTSSVRAHADTSDEAQSPSGHNGRRVKGKKTLPVNIRPQSPELPDSTDFVCGTLDEDRPLEEAFIANRKQKLAAKKPTRPQDIDPSFPTSDPELAHDDFDEEDEVSEEDQKKSKTKYARNKEHRTHRSIFMHGFEDDDEPRGRKQSNGLPKGCITPPHRRAKSPAPPTTIKHRAKSPAPKAMMRSPPPPPRLVSPPPPSRHASKVNSPSPRTHSFFYQGSYEPTHTSSLPRSPKPKTRRRPSGEEEDEEEDSGEETEHEKPYARGAIDILQGLERKRLKRREKLYMKHCKNKEHKKEKRPQPGRGAERMRQIGIECAIYRGTRVLSV